MKNKKIITIVNIFVFLLLIANQVIAQEFNFKGSEIIFLDKENKIRGINGINLTDNNGIKITGEKFEYDKIKMLLNVEGNVIIYDDVNKLVLKSDKFTYNKKKEIIYTKTITTAEYNKEYLLDSNELTFDRSTKKNIFSKKIKY